MHGPLGSTSKLQSIRSLGSTSKIPNHRTSRKHVQISIHRTSRKHVQIQIHGPLGSTSKIPIYRTSGKHIQTSIHRISRKHVQISNPWTSRKHVRNFKSIRPLVSMSCTHLKKKKKRGCMHELRLDLILPLRGT